MRRLDELKRLRTLFLATSFCFIFQGALCVRLVSPVGPTLLKVIVGSNITLAVSLSVTSDTMVTWKMGSVTVGTWTGNSSAAPSIAPGSRDVLKIEKDGSLTFVNVPLNYSSEYTIKLTILDEEDASTTFTLKVFEIIQNVTLTSGPDFAREGADRFTLQYSMKQGEAEQQVWFFNGHEIIKGLHYSVEKNGLVINRPTRNDTGRYTVTLTNPFSSMTAHENVTVRYGPDVPVLKAHPVQPFYTSGASLTLSCQAEGYPPPTAKWIFGDQILSDSQDGVLNLTNVQTSHGGVYICEMANKHTGEKNQNNLTLKVYEKPSGNPLCSVESLNIVDLQYHCQWIGGTPPARLSFPDLSNSSSGTRHFSLTVTASDNLNRKIINCVAEHPVKDGMCNITASSPEDFLPSVRTSVDSDAKITVTIHCVSEAMPLAVVSWSTDREALTNGTTYQISNNTTQLKIRHYNVSYFLHNNYSCTCRNPLGSLRRTVQLHGPAISDSSLFRNHDGTIITLTWEVPPTSVVTGFDIQMKGPDIPDSNRNASLTKSSSDGYRTIQWKAGTARSTDIFFLNPDSTYHFRVVPKARQTEGQPSEVHRTGQGDGLSGPAIAGIAAGIPCSLLFLLLLAVLVYLCVYCSKNKSHQMRYPIPRAVEKAKTAQPDTTPHNLLAGGLRIPPDYNRLHQTPSERSVALPTFVPPPPVRVATTV
ncbi:V-set and immunoglobulin domain-containing protein 10-like [Parambassis ranga]|uniref:V-set and immunoglobulin domain-containing protein 10-like n=1 Tax=Parambassis ranga TaxID=210632 RepID=UPI001042268F|nr:V-set and immunoglobulin domain-containing protein 10-like [Parambassis ranga]